jgi:hypothetical protein
VVKWILKISREKPVMKIRTTSLPVLMAAALTGSVIFYSETDEAVAAQVVEHLDRMEINWSTQKIRFYGESGPGENTLKGVDGAEKRAWSDGLTYIEGSVHDYSVSVFEGLSSNTEKVSADARAAAKNITKSVYSYNTLYFSDGTVRVYLESSLPKAMTTSLIRFRQKEAASAQIMQRTGVVIRLNSKVSPRPRYQVLDETGVPLFEAKDMAEEGFARNLMGRWYEAPADAEAADFVGKNPVYIDASVDPRGNLVVARDLWKGSLDGHKALLVNGLIAIVLPSSGQVQ